MVEDIFLGAIEPLPAFVLGGDESPLLLQPNDITTTTDPTEHATLLNDIDFTGSTPFGVTDAYTLTVWRLSGLGNQERCQC